jgi:hypothetical protein
VPPWPDAGENRGGEGNGGRGRRERAGRADGLHASAGPREHAMRVSAGASARARVGRALAGPS